MASSRGLPHPLRGRLSFEGDYLSRATIHCVITVDIKTSILIGFTISLEPIFCLNSIMKSNLVYHITTAINLPHVIIFVFNTKKLVCQGVCVPQFHLLFKIGILFFRSPKLKLAVFQDVPLLDYNICWYLTKQLPKEYSGEVC